MPIRDRITWGSKDSLSDPRLKDLDKYVNGILEGRMPPNVESGGVFENRENYLPEKAGKYYHEYYVETKVAGKSRGKLRLILGLEGEVYVSGDHYGIFRQIVGIPIRTPKNRTAESLAERNVALVKLNNYRIKLQNLVELYSGEHKMELDLATNTFFGIVTNALYNNDIPPLTIWQGANMELSAAETALRNKKLASPFKSLLRARLKYLRALKKYETWKNGIVPAGKMMERAIENTAINIITDIICEAPIGEGEGAAVTDAAEEAAGTDAASAAASTETAADSVSSEAVQVERSRFKTTLKMVDARIRVEDSPEAVAQTDEVLESAIEKSGL